ncbi:hypothetical protein RclHR1_00740004 [Rhizophagus clarus]|uniref:Uncharacterized protein n=1 Tax=Rhizophagus clarus TaxID=94130 RepID=A0A2Z6RYI4_9GLOM|nr:hypothetical protein RclHR1_00740004 [Rhizophagus clarus]
MRPWTSFQRSETLFQGGSLSPKFFRDRLIQNSLEADRYFEDLELYFEIQNSISRRTIKSETPLEMDYDILKVQNSLEMNWYFEGLELFRDGPVQKSLEADWYFEGLELFRGGPVFQKSGTLFRGGSLSPELLKVDWYFEANILGGGRFWNSLSLQAMIFEDSLSQQTIKVWIFQFKADQSISKIELHFETDQICNFQIWFTDFWKLPET